MLLNMRPFSLFCATLLVCFCVTSALARENKPDPRLTPGEVVATTDLSVICKHGYSASVRHTTADMKRKAYKDYGIKSPHKNFKIDHLVPLCIGGADSQKNIWPTDFDAKDHTAADKDRFELKAHDLICHGEMNIRDGQKIFMTDWRKGYDKYCPTRADCPSYMEIQEMIKAREALRQEDEPKATKEKKNEPH